jgi:hypothetical protein
VRITNRRTGEHVDTALDELGQPVEPLRIAGLPGDELTVAVSDGAGNTDFQQYAGTLRAPVPRPQRPVNPAPLGRDGAVNTFVAGVPLFVNGVSVHDPRQGAMGNCFFVAGVAAMALVSPEETQNLVTDHGDGTFTFRFFDSKTLEPVEVTVDATLYGDNGAPRYGWSDRELWFELLEKAYAVWKGGYDKIDLGSAGQVLTELTGRPSQQEWIYPTSSTDEVYAVLRDGLQKKRPMAMGTWGQEFAEQYATSGVYPSHAYTVMDALQGDDGRRWVTLRNPWGNRYMGDLSDNGVFTIPLEEFVRLSQVLNLG